MAYEELFLFQLKLQAYRAHTRRKRDGIAHTADNAAIREFAAGAAVRADRRAEESGE